MIRLWAIGCGLLLLAALAWPSQAIDRRGEDGKAGDWPQWRGPNRDDVSPDTGLLDHWPEGGPPLLWKHEGLGSGYSSVVIADGRIFTTGDRDGTQWLFALKRDNGDELWKIPAGEAWDHDPNGYTGSRSTPTVDGNHVYLIGTHGDLICLNVKDGEKVWEKNLAKEFGVPVPHWGFSESPLIDGDKLLCTPGGAEVGIVAVNKNTGAEIWRTAIPPLGNNGKDSAGYSSIVISNGAGKKQYVQLTGRGVVGIDAATGKFLWGYNRVVNGVANIPTPLVHGDYVFSSTGYQGGAALLKLKPVEGGVEAEEVYFLDGKALQNHHGQMVMLGDYVYLGHGHNGGAPTCVEWKTGEIKWRQNHGPGNRTAHVTSADGNLYFRYETPGLMALVAAKPDGYEERGTFQIPGSEKPSWSHPVVIGGKLYLREQNTLFCYDVRKK